MQPTHSGSLKQATPEALIILPCSALSGFTTYWLGGEGFRHQPVIPGQ